MKKLLQHIPIAVIGGLMYMGIEILWRGHTHWTMGVLGGLCFVLIGLLDDYSDMPGNLWGQVCPQFAAAWLLLSWAAVKLENLMHKWAGDAQ